MELSQRRRRLLERLRQRRGRVRERRVLVEGTRAVAEALDCGARPAFIVLAEGFAGTEGGARWIEVVGSADVVSVSDRRFDELAATEHPQGVLAVVEEPLWSVRDVTSRARVLVLDAIQDPGNVGTLIRSAVAFGIEGALCLDGTADPWGAKAVRASAGCVFRIPVATADTAEAVGSLREVGTPILVASADGEGAAGRRASFALALGNEGGGVRRALKAAADATIAVRMRGPAESLNVGIAGSILMHELTKEDG